jgi:hypothetical protein
MPVFIQVDQDVRAGYPGIDSPPVSQVSELIVGEGFVA